MTGRGGRVLRSTSRGCSDRIAFCPGLCISLLVHLQQNSLKCFHCKSRNKQDESLFVTPYNWYYPNRLCGRHILLDLLIWEQGDLLPVLQAQEARESQCPMAEKGMRRSASNPRAQRNHLQQQGVEKQSRCGHAAPALLETLPQGCGD